MVPGEPAGGAGDLLCDRAGRAAGEELGFDYDAGGLGYGPHRALPVRTTWADGAHVVDAVVPAPTVEKGLENAAQVVRARGVEARVPWYVRVERCPPSHPAAPGFMVVAATAIPPRTLIGRYAGLLRAGSANDYGDFTPYRFDLLERFSEQTQRRVLRETADVADWTLSLDPGVEPTAKAGTPRRKEAGPEATPEALEAMARAGAGGRAAPESAAALLQAAAQQLRHAGPTWEAPAKLSEASAKATGKPRIDAVFKVAKGKGSIAKR